MLLPLLSCRFSHLTLMRKTLHLYEARYLALLEESLARKYLFVHFVLDPILVSNSGTEASFAARYGCLVHIENGNWKGQDVAIFAEPYLKGEVIPMRDRTVDHEINLSSKIDAVKEALYKLNSLEIKLKLRKLLAMDVRDTVQRLDVSLDFLNANISMVAAKLAIQSNATFDCTSSVLVQSNCESRRSFRENTTRRICCSLLKVEADVGDDEACELVNGVELSIGEGADSIDAYLLRAVKNNNETGILLLSDIFGFEDSSTRDFAYRVACNGYNVLVPDLFRGDPWSKDRPNALLEQWIAKQDRERVAKDIDAAAKWMVDEFSAAGISKKLGLIGFCFGGGRVVEVLSRDQGACFGTGVSFYGTRIDTSLAPNIKVPVLFISGDNDPLCSVSMLKDLERSIGQGTRVVIYEERGHAFAHRPNSPEEDKDAEDAFTIMRNWLYEGLVVEKSVQGQ
ncbi:hypothetical protein Tsubulata_015527 [Turnera subulata]|uniref:Carboxymethylenebutenolidase homolog n=1 Tax=Turnera subulata TaxID=218843 RepID=A0A9Q0F1T7_9ROSI|nr:hypothetical protein Tsubulata_015527 [Turnera subulata]